MPAGYHLGEHTLFFGKSHPYNTDVSLPFYIRGPGLPPNTTRLHPTNHLDITATIVDLASEWLDGVCVVADHVHMDRSCGQHKPIYTALLRHDACTSDVDVSRSQAPAPLVLLSTANLSKRHLQPLPSPRLSGGSTNSRNISATGPVVQTRGGR